MTHDECRIEKDVLGEVPVPKNVYWGIATQRSMMNFAISGKRFPEVFVRSLAEVKKACLEANLHLSLLDAEMAAALNLALDELLVHGKHLDQFPVDIYQTGSGTQFNMNMNEVLANRANECLGHPLGGKHPVHPNDHVNMGQSSNDAIPTAMHLSALHSITDNLTPAMLSLRDALTDKIEEFDGILKMGRTHLQDAVPIPLSLEFEVYRRQVDKAMQRLVQVADELREIPLGGTALGTGVGAAQGFADLAVENLSRISGVSLSSSPVKAEAIASHNALVQTSATLRQLALSLLKMANDVRWLGSGPRGGLGELLLPTNEPGSSIMPGKINPTQSEALIQVAVQVVGNDAAIAMAESTGSVLDLNVCKPVMIYNLLDSITLLSNGISSFVDNCLKGLKADADKMAKTLERSLMLVTNLSPYVGYDTCAEIAQRAHAENKTIKEVVLEMGLDLDRPIDELLDPKSMT
jgi:fumarate hydratase class II